MTGVNVGGAGGPGLHRHSDAARAAGVPGVGLRHRAGLPDGRRCGVEACALRLLRMGPRRSGGRAAPRRGEPHRPRRHRGNRRGGEQRHRRAVQGAARRRPKRRSSASHGRLPRCWSTARSARRKSWKRGCPTGASATLAARVTVQRIAGDGAADASSYEQGDPEGRFASIVTIRLRDGRCSTRASSTADCGSRSPAGTKRGWTRSSAGWRGLCWTKRVSTRCPAGLAIRRDWPAQPRVDRTAHAA